MKYVRALVACFGVILVYIVIGWVMGWKHGGGFFPLLILFAALSGTWRVFTKGDRGKKAAFKVTTPEISSSESMAPNRGKEFEPDNAPADSVPDTPETRSSESTVSNTTNEIEHDNIFADSAPAIKLFCTQCGIQNQSNANFCWKCGHAMRRDQDSG